MNRTREDETRDRSKRHKRKVMRKKKNTKRGKKKRLVATRQRSIASTQNALRVLYTRLHIERIRKLRGSGKEEGGTQRRETLVSGATCSRTRRVVYARGLIKRLVRTLFSFSFIVCIPETKANARIAGRGGESWYRQPGGDLQVDRGSLPPPSSRERRRAERSVSARAA